MAGDFVGDGEQYSEWVGLIYIFNLIVGTGALALPAVFAKAGWLLSIVIIVVLAFMGYVTVTYVIEVMACGNAMLVMTHGGATPAGSYTLDKRVELGEMTHLFFNKVGRYLFYFILCVYLYGDLVIYIAAISRTLTDLVCETRMSSTIPGKCWADRTMSQMNMYRIMICVFIVTVGPLSYFKVQKTKYLQIATSTLRWIAFLTMIFLALSEIIIYGAHGHPPAVNIKNLPRLIGVCVYSFMCHHSIPGMVTPFSNKSHVMLHIALDYGLICLFYLLLSLTGAIAFDDIDDLYTLNFVPEKGNVSGIKKAVEYFLTLFPLFTLSTNFPIIAITLQRNLKIMFLNPDKMDEYNFFVKFLLFPTIAIIPPTIIALVTRDFNLLVSFTGTYAGSAIQYIVPALLVWCARKKCKEVVGSEAVNEFGSPFKGTLWVIFVVLWSVVCIIFSTVNLFLPK